MSLTSFLDNADVRKEFSSDFTKPKSRFKKEIVARPLTKNYSLVGTAFDYLLRFYLEYLNPQFVQEGGWIANLSLLLLSDEHLDRGTAIVEQAERNLVHFLETGRRSEELLRSALQLASLDPIFRAGLGEENIGVVDERDIQDLSNLISAVDFQIFKAEEHCLLNPSFGKASLLVGGADADLIIDDTIIEIKTTKSLELTRNHFNQLIGYYILYNLSDVSDGEDPPEIDKLAVYFSRYAYFHVIAVNEIVSDKTFEQFARWFVVQATIEFGKQPWSFELWRKASEVCSEKKHWTVQLSLLSG